jgi:hypothetical protein
MEWKWNRALATAAGAYLLARRAGLSGGVQTDGYIVFGGR